MNDPAFPRPGYQPPYGDFVWGNDGMTLRDYFAAAAMQGMLANSYADGVQKPLSLASFTEMAEMAFKQADAMLAARELPQKEQS